MICDCRTFANATSLFTLVAGIVAFGGCQPSAIPPATQSPQTIDLAQADFDAGRWEPALQAAQSLLVANPDDMLALRIASRSHANQGRFDDAASLATRLARIAKASGNVTEETLSWSVAADWHLRAGDDAASISNLTEAVKSLPQDANLRRMLAQLLTAQGRRAEACVHVIELERLGGMTAAEMLSLVDRSGPFRLLDYGDLTKRSGPSQFDLAAARMIVDQEHDLHKAIALLAACLESHPDYVAARAYQGRLIADTGDRKPLASWLERDDDGLRNFADYWYAAGTSLASQGQDREAIRAFGEAIRRDPTDRAAMASMAVSLDRVGLVEELNQVSTTRGMLDEVSRTALKATPEQSIWVGQQMQSFVRPWESLAWYRHAYTKSGQANSQSATLDRRREKLTAWQQDATDQQIENVRLKSMLGFDIETFPMPPTMVADMDNIATKTDDDLMPSDQGLRFTDVADSVGIAVPFISDYPADGLRFFLHQANGGGIAALDYDRDGWCDLYFAQSGGDPRIPNASTPNQCFRNLEGKRFANVTSAGANDRGFGQGVCAADLNQDGFADLLVANIGANAIYINQGDGSFRLAENHVIPDNEFRWTSSIAAGDLNGDALPDIFEVNYINDPKIYEISCSERQQTCTPQRFTEAADRCLINKGDGTFALWQTSLANYGLGVVITNVDDTNGNDVFVSNDGDFNHYWKSTASVQPMVTPYQLTQCAAAVGCAVSRNGYSQACMGVASGDIDRNGRMDLLVANFFSEPMSLYLQNKSGIFSDECTAYGLVAPSMAVLGFGTQAADFDNDGWLDAAVLNGHLYDSKIDGIPFRMVSQLFRGKPGRFVAQAADRAGPYWQREQLGRTLMTLDFDRDGRVDLIANHLDQPAALLRNETESANWTAIELVGVRSERDAIGARMDVFAGGETWTRWRTGGDGYMGSCENIMHVGIGDHDKIERIDIRWPSGETQTIPSPPRNQRLLVVEGES